MKYDIGPRVRKYREALNLSQKEFAELIGVSNSRVSNWEQGINRPDVDILARICEILKVSPSELLDIYIPPNEDVFKDLDISDDDKQLVKQYTLLSDGDKKLIKSMISSLSEKTDHQK